MNEAASGHTQNETSKTSFPEWPWLTILIQPRSTIRAIVDSDPKLYVVPLAVLYGIANGLSRSESRSYADTMPLPMVLIIAIAVGGIGGLAGLHISGWILTRTGGWFGGKANSEYVRAAMAWSAVPVILTLLFVPLMLLLYGSDLYTIETPLVDSNPIPYMLVGFLEIVLTVWWLFLFWKCYAEVQQISLPKAFIAIAAPGFIVGVIMFGCALLTLWE